MVKNEKGFGIVGVLLIVDSILLVIAGTLLVFAIQSAIVNSGKPHYGYTDQSSTDRRSGNRADTTPKKIDTAIHDVAITLNTEADLAKLPSYTPESFKTYMAGILRNNTPSYNGEADVTMQYRISKISQVNISGGLLPVDKDGNGYPGGAPIIWVLTPSGSWDLESLNSAACTSKNGGKVYVEFVSQCATIRDDYSSWQKNPNGSILSIND